MRASVLVRLHVRSTSTGLRFAQVVAVFVLLFAVQCVLSTVSYVREWVRSRNWQQVSATLTEVTFDSAAASEDSPPWITLRYQYSYRGETYTGDRLTLAGSPLYLKPLLQDTGNRLAESLDSKTPVDCYVDPQHSSTSVLERTFFVTVLACRGGTGALASLIGGLLLMVPTSELNRRDRTAALRSSWPAEPWRWREDWSTGRIRSVSHVDSQILIGVAAVYLFLLLPLGLLVVKEHGRDLLSVPGITLIIGGWGAFNLARTRLWSHRRFDGSEFQLAGQTGVIGGPLYGSITIPASARGDTPLRLSLECIALEHVQENSAREHSRIDENVLWRDTSLLQRTLQSGEPGATLVPVYFAIPDDCQSSRREGNPSIHWFLKIGPAGGEGLAEYAAFEVPVFRTPESSPDFKANPDVMAKFVVPLELQGVLEQSGCAVETSSDETLIRFSLFRQKHLLQGLTLVSILGSVAAALMIYAPTLWAILPAVAAGVIVLASGDRLLWRSEIRKRDQQIIAVAGLWGFQKRLRITRDIVASVEPDVEYAMKERTAYLVKLTAIIPMEGEADGEGVGPQERDGRKHDSAEVQAEESELDIQPEVLVVARGLSSERAAELLSEWLAEQLGLTHSGLMKSLNDK